MKKMNQTNPPYLILQKWNRILNTSNPVACALDNIGSKCKIMYRFKISASAGMMKLTNVCHSRLPARSRFGEGR